MTKKRRRSSKTASSRRERKSRSEDFQGSAASEADRLSTLANYLSIAASVFRMAVCAVCESLDHFV